MSYIKIFELDGRKSVLGYEHLCESDLQLDYKVIAPKSGTYYKIFKVNELVAEVNWGNIILEGKKLLKRKSGNEWVLSYNPEQYISIEEPNLYSLNGKAVASTSSGGDLFSSQFYIH